MEKRTRNAEIILKEKAEKAEANNSKFCYGLNMTPLTEAERKQREENGRMVSIRRATIVVCSESAPLTCLRR